MRRVRPTLRCLVTDLGIEVPPLTDTLESVDHPLLDEVRRIAPGSPQGQKPILSIKDEMVFRVQKGRTSGATWVDDESEIVWLLAAETREEGSRDDAYEYFQRLHVASKLMPTDDDQLRDRAETPARFYASLMAQAPAILEMARGSPGSEIRATIGEAVDVVVLLYREENLEEMWLAVDTRMGARVRDVTFAVFEQALEGAEWEFRGEWPTRELKWFEVARMALRQATS